MAGTLKHAKTSGKAAPTDTTKVGGPDWDADHNFAGGALGSLLYRDTGATDGANWLADVAAGSFLRSGGVGAAPVWSTTTWPNSAATGDLLYASGANAYANLADVATGSVLVSGGIGTAPAWSASPSLTDVTLSGQLTAGNGSKSAPALRFAGATNTGWLWRSSVMEASVVGAPVMQVNSTTFVWGGSAGIAWAAGDVQLNSPDLFLVRDAANILAQRNSTSAQAFRLYNSFTDASNYERATFAFQSNTLVLQQESAGTGTARGFNIGTVGGTNLQFFTSNTVRWQISSSGHLICPLADNTYDIGASGATRPRTVYIGTSLVLPGGTLLTTSAALTNGAAAATGTLTNAPAAGNPTKWIPINDNGTTRYIPAW